MHHIRVARWSDGKFSNQKSQLGIFCTAFKWKMLVYLMAIWSVSRLLGIFFCYLVYFMVIGYIFPRFGMLYQGKSGTLHHITIFYQHYCDTVAQSFSPFLAQDGRQVRCPSWIWATSLCYILLNKFVALVGSGQQTCRPSRDEKGLKDWASDIGLIWFFFCQVTNLCM
jgi:hypothetical protein